MSMKPIHVHAKKGEFESKAEFIIIAGKVTEVKIKNSQGFQPLKTKDLKGFKSFLSVFADQIVQK